MKVLIIVLSVFCFISCKKEDVCTTCSIGINVTGEFKAIGKTETHCGSNKEIEQWKNGLRRGGYEAKNCQ